MTSLQLVLVIAGVLLVIGVIVYNVWQERRLRERLGARERETRPTIDTPSRVEPTLARDASTQPAGTRVPPTIATPNADVAHDPEWNVPMDGVVRLPDSDDAEQTTVEVSNEALSPPIERVRRGRVQPAGAVAAPDPDIETIVMVQPSRAIGASALAAGLHARLGKPIRWYGRRQPGEPWQRLGNDSRGEYNELAACMLLADRNGPVTQVQIESFRKLVGDIAARLPGASSAPPSPDEAQRAEALDRLCADLDMQIGLTVRKAPPATIAGTRLRGVAEASGFRLAPTGRFEWVQDDTGAVLFTLQNVTDEAFTTESLRHAATPGVVFLLDVPRVADPPRAFDQMKLAAKRMAQTVGGELVDDNGRALNDAGLAAIREQVAAADAALRRYNIEPGSPRALKLFAA
ncbi:MAG TPA: cell division protein ZipA C-terminal FtsZ-binding domain-containing protein [Casimicrobiaceae bacterium]|nr:cell division protein ZipA C-terminal FtsZ-binding domain-containing protein [Casimicrobiaceae bacterium]